VVRFPRVYNDDQRNDASTLKWNSIRGGADALHRLLILGSALLLLLLLFPRLLRPLNTPASSIRLGQPTHNDTSYRTHPQRAQPDDQYVRNSATEKEKTVQCTHAIFCEPSLSCQTSDVPDTKSPMLRLVVSTRMSSIANPPVTTDGIR
jgi:hypothetical protein